MTTTTLFKKCSQLWTRTHQQSEEYERSIPNFYERTERQLQLYDEALRHLKIWVQNYEFATWEEEIRFFKSIKPPFASQFIYLSKLLTLETYTPYGDVPLLQTYYQKELDSLHYYFHEHRDFIAYYRRNATYLDGTYYLRHRHDLKMKISPDYHTYDHRFTTLYDTVVAHVMAYDQLEEAIKTKLSLLQGNPTSTSRSPVSSLKWTGSKTALIELLTALHRTQCLNGGYLEFSELIRWAEHHFSIDLGNYHKTIGELRNRKIERTKFLKLLYDSLNRYFDDFDSM